MKVLRLAATPIQAKQLAVLRRFLGDDIEVVEANAVLPKGPKHLVRKFDELTNGFDVVEVGLSLGLEVILPILKLSEFSQSGRPIIRGRTPSLDEDHPTFSKYEVLKDVRVTTIPLTKYHTKFVVANFRNRTPSKHEWGAMRTELMEALRRVTMELMGPGTKVMFLKSRNLQVKMKYTGGISFLEMNRCELTYALLEEAERFLVKKGFLDVWVTPF